MTLYYDGLKLAEALENPHTSAKLDLPKVASVLRILSERMHQALKAANDLAESMDSVYTDRVALAARVEELTAERHQYQAPGSSASMVQ